MAKEAKKADAKTDAKKEAPKAEKVTREVVTVKAGALSTNVGPEVLAGLAKAYDAEVKANTIMMEVESKRYDLLSQLTAAIVKAAKADDSIDLSVAFGTDNKKAMNVLNDQIGLAIGTREKVETTDAGGNVIPRIQVAKSVAKYLSSDPKLDKDSPAAKRMATLRTNFAHQLKKCIQAASGIIEKDITFKPDASGTLQISGPEVKKAFGVESVLLNEKQTLPAEGDAEPIKLTQKPSFTALAKMGAEAAGKVLEPRKDSRVAGTASDPAKSLQDIAKALASACSKIKLPADDETKRALSIAQSAIDKVLQGSQAAA